MSKQMLHPVLEMLEDRSVPSATVGSPSAVAVLQVREALFAITPPASPGSLTGGNGSGNAGFGQAIGAGSAAVARRALAFSLWVGSVGLNSQGPAAMRPPPR